MTLLDPSRFFMTTDPEWESLRIKLTEPYNDHLTQSFREVDYNYTSILTFGDEISNFSGYNKILLSTSYNQS